jgi:DNA mismatch repair protein MutL
MYIVVEGKDSMELYDQHIVHERILYEELKEKHYSTEVASQNLLVPVKIEVDPVDKQVVLENLNVFQEFGFEVEEFGDNELLIRAVPVFDFRESIQDTFFYMLEQLKEYSKRDIRESIIISMSCKNAIKAGEKLEVEEINILLNKLHEIGKYTCPHGRPIIVRLPYLELDKKFGRK